MPLDFTQVSTQLDELVEETTAARRQTWLTRAREHLRTLDQEALHEKLTLHRRQRLPWLTAVPLGDLHTHHAPPAPPATFSVAAADGSSIPPDHHSPVRFYLLNTGWVRLTYGETGDFTSGVDTRLRYRTDELYFDPDDRLLPVEGSRLSALMSVAELEALQTAVAEAPSSDAREGVPTGEIVGLLDGTMILWTIQNEKRIQTEVLGPYLELLDWFFERRIPVGSYISSPGSYELANMLRVAICPEPSTECKRCHASSDETLRLCYEVREFRDALLLASELAPGERTCLFQSQSEILNAYGRHIIRFFYLHTGEEIGRVEVPAWVAEDDTLLDRLHAVLWDQCRRSGHQAYTSPYPPALHEAHEQAVISTADRRLVEQLLIERLAQADLFLLESAKARHKRTRGL